MREALAAAFDSELKTWADARAHFDRVFQFAESMEAIGVSVEIRASMSIKVVVPENFKVPGRIRAGRRRGTA